MDLVRDYIDANVNEFQVLSNEDYIKLHEIHLEMIRDFISFCNSRGIVYFLGGGTSLGAVRNQGFIPWDDDVDMVVTKEGFRILSEEYERAFPGKYTVEAPNSKNVGSFAFMKIKKKGTKLRELMEEGPEYGIFMDVFPIEFAPMSKVLRAIYAKTYFLFQGVAYTILFSEQYRKVMKRGLVNCSAKTRLMIRLGAFAGRIIGIIPQKWWINHFDKMVEKKASDLCVIPTGLHGYKKECFPYEVYFPPKKGMFEGMEVNLPNKIEDILTVFYVDYMSPPKDADKVHHFFFEIDLGSRS